MYLHRDTQGQLIDLPVGKVVCVGRNYMDHIAEMRSSVSSSPLLFMKPKAAMCTMQDPLILPRGQGECHNEVELAVLIQAPLSDASEADVMRAIWGVGLGLDLTLRDVQSRLKADGQPWERAKAFNRSCPLTGFLPLSLIDDLQDLSFSLSINGKMRQQGNTSMMIHPVIPLIQEMSSVFELEPGDVIMTGTPAGVGPLLPGDQLELQLISALSVSTQVASI